jgi:hypothetical protein
MLPGTRLIVRRHVYSHHGIYVGNDRVIHYAGWFHSARGLVEEVTIKEFSEGRPYSIGRKPANRQRGEQIVRRARSRLGERCYHLLRNNCEHFCNWCQLGECRSEQVDALARPMKNAALMLSFVIGQLLVGTGIAAPPPDLATASLLQAHTTKGFALGGDGAH